MIKIGFIVEGDTDAIVIRALVERIAPADARMSFIRAGGKIGIFSSSPTVSILQSQGFDHVFILFDADTASQETVTEQEARLREMLVERGLYHQVTICPVVPDIEAWILAGMIDMPDIVADTKEAFSEQLYSRQFRGDIRRLLKALDVDLLRRRNRSFSDFAQHVEQIAAPVNAR